MSQAEVPTSPEAAEAPQVRATPEVPDWQRFHPLTPLLRGGIVFLAVVAAGLSQQTDRIFGDGDVVPDRRTLLVGGGVLLMAALGAFGVGWLTWRISRFRVGATSLELHTGLLFRQHRQLRYDRVQAIDVCRPLLARLAGLSELRLQAAGGNESDVSLAFLGATRADELRAHLLGLAGRSDEHGGIPEGESAQDVPTAADGGAAGSAATRPSAVLLRIPNVRLVQSLAYSGTTLFILLCIPAVLLGLSLDAGWVLATLGPALLATVPRQAKRLLTEANFELNRTDTTLWIRHGLTETRTSTVPLHRIQAISVTQPLFWRPVGWWRMEVNVAGVKAEGDDSADVIVPVGTFAEVLVALRAVRPALGEAIITDAVELAGPRTGWVVASPRSSWVSPLVRQRQGYAVSEDCIVLRHGRFSRTIEVVPHARIQSLKANQGPVDRRLGLSTVDLVSTPGSIAPRVPHLHLADAEVLVGEQTLRSRRARKLSSTPTDTA